MGPAPRCQRAAPGSSGRGGAPRPACAMDLSVGYLARGRTLVTRRMMAQPDSDLEEDALKKDLKFYFMNPCEKYRARRQIPWKLGLQILKIVMVTTQLILFGLSNQLVVSFKEENTIAFKHLFLKGYSGVDEDDYSCSVYTQQDVYDSIFFAINQYRQLKTISLGTLGYEQDEDDVSGLQICKQQYKKGTMLPSNDSLNIDIAIETDCIHLEPQMLATTRSGDLKMINSSFFNFEFYRLIQVEISFQLKGIDLQTIHARELPDCYAFQNTITFNNRAHSGKVKIYFDSDADIQECKDWHISGSIVQKNTQYILVFDGFVIVSCFASLILCTRSIVLALKLQKRFVNFFLEKYKRHVCHADRLEFINGWYVLVIISDVMTIIGSIMKMEIKAKVLILTMQASLPKVLRFCCCAGMIYLGYTFCGWIVLGPYHEKFEDLNTVAECLFSLVNGDDMFATFAQIQQKSTLVWLFSRLYLYSFISLFIYMILSLFIALITDSYDTIKKYQQNGFPVTDLHEFLKECSSTDYSKEPQASMPFICCCRRRGSDDNLILIN
ncbi:mucolipin-2 isoform X2 [Lepidochelys kempii]|uniref:mucolipin-2 isoform X2 n=1 Tax=Lepidochelys kempii TaxID=8472 RepID=UPI003C6EBBD4